VKFYRLDRNLGLFRVLVIMLVFELAFGLGDRLAVGLVFGLVFGLTFGPVFTWWTALASAQMRLAHGTPLRLIRFLEDAQARQVLRTVGNVYQFRHARLQDRLAGYGNTESRP
jgi:hypothetical protein